MIFELKFTDREEFVQARSMANMVANYTMEYGEEEVFRIKNVKVIRDEDAKTITLRNTDTSTFDECPEISLYDLSCGDEFCIIGSTEW